MKEDNFKLAEYEIKELLYNELLREDIGVIRQKHGIPDSGFTSPSDKDSWFEDKSKVEQDEYIESIHTLMFNFSLGQKWRDGLSLYVELANEKYLRVKHSWTLKFSYTGDSSEPRNLRDIRIEVDPSITQEELKNAHDALKRLVSKAGMKNKSQYVENLDRDYEVYMMRKSGKTVKEVSNWLNDNMPGTFNDDNVKKIFIRASSRFGKRHPWPK